MCSLQAGVLTPSSALSVPGSQCLVPTLSNEQGLSLRTVPRKESDMLMVPKRLAWHDEKGRGCGPPHPNTHTIVRVKLDTV